MTQLYRGRFAPSPTGPLHFGSLVAALASYLDAKANNGQWLVRMEDLDPPREQPGAAQNILDTLAAFQLHWDETVMFQSTQHSRYQQRLDELVTQQKVYACQCTRKQIKAAGGIYPNSCRDKQLAITPDSPLRVRQPSTATEFQDGIQTAQSPNSLSIDPQKYQEDFVVKRRDGLFAYQLAVVVDDIDQAITHVVRGADLLDSTPWQLTLFDYFAAPAPQYFHIPLVSGADGQKLSKQNLAPAIDAQQAQSLLVDALHFLAQKPPENLKRASCHSILEWGVAHWQLSKIPASGYKALDD